MATLVINRSGGIVPLDSLKVVILPGCRKEFVNTYDQLMAMAPELHLLEKRGHVIISEDAILVKDDHAAEEPHVPEEPPSNTEVAEVLPIKEEAANTVQQPVVVPSDVQVVDSVQPGSVDDTKKSKKHKGKKLDE